jgi:hypothetical protein
MGMYLSRYLQVHATYRKFFPPTQVDHRFYRKGICELLHDFHFMSTYYKTSTKYAHYIHLLFDWFSTGQQMNTSLKTALIGLTIGKDPLPRDNPICAAGDRDKADNLYK